MIETFKTKYGLEVNELDPDAGSADELEAIKAYQGNTGPQAPDVIDVGFAFGSQAKDESLIQPYKVSTWDSFPADAKDADGYWYGDYYGVLAFAVNTDVVANVPTDWPDLLKPEYAGQVASIVVLEKIGMNFIGNFDFELHPGVKYAILKNDYLQQQANAK